MDIDVKEIKKAVRTIASGKENLPRPKAGMDGARNAERTIDLITRNVKASMDGVILGGDAICRPVPRDAIGI